MLTMADDEVTARARILCVDDNVPFVTALQKLLAREYEVTTATSAEEAYEKLDTNGPFEVIVADLRLPEVEGGDLLTELFRRSPDSERVILTGWADPDMVGAVARDCGAMRVLFKPCPMSELREAISDALIRRRARHLRRHVPANGTGAAG